MSSFIGKKAPTFTLPNQAGIDIALTDYLGKKILLYFYPKDMTSGCTIEAELFRDYYPAFQKLLVDILGVSADTVSSHEKFYTKSKLPFMLLSDTEKTVVNKYGVWVEKSMYGRTYMGIQRDSFLIDENGIVLKHYINVKPKVHAEEVLKDLTELANS